MKKEGKKGGLYYYLGLLVDDMIETIISNMSEILNAKRVHKKDDELGILLIGRFGFDALELDDIEYLKGMICAQHSDYFKILAENYCYKNGLPIEMAKEIDW